MAIAAFFLAFIGAAVVAGRLPPAVLGLYVAASALAYLAYARDKAAARTGGWRTRESTLHILALLGGWPGAWLAQNRLRHKTKKRSFRAVFSATVLLNCGALGWLFAAPASNPLRAILGAS